MMRDKDGHTMLVFMKHHIAEIKTHVMTQLRLLSGIHLTSSEIKDAQSSIFQNMARSISNQERMNRNARSTPKADARDEIFDDTDDFKQVVTDVGCEDGMDIQSLRKQLPGRRAPDNGKGSTNDMPQNCSSFSVSATGLV